MTIDGAKENSVEYELDASHVMPSSATSMARATLNVKFAFRDKKT